MKVIIIKNKQNLKTKLFLGVLGAILTFSTINLSNTKINASFDNTTNSVHNQNDIFNDYDDIIISEDKKTKEKTEAEEHKENENLKIKFKNLLALTKELKEKINDKSIKSSDKPKIIINYANKINKIIFLNFISYKSLMKIICPLDFAAIKNYIILLTKHIANYNYKKDEFIIKKIFNTKMPVVNFGQLI